MNILKKTLKVEVITKYFHPVSAGIETNIRETYSVLAEKGWEITIHTSKDTLIKKDTLGSKDWLRGLIIKRYHFSSIGFIPKINWKKTDIVALHNFDIFPHFYLLVYFLYLKILGKKKFALFLIPHGGFNPEWSIFPLAQRLIKRFYNFTLGTWLINSTVDGVRAVSNWEGEQMRLKKINNELISIIPNGVESEAYWDSEKKASRDIKKKVKAYEKYIIQVGRVYVIKNYETTIKALALGPKNLNYVIAGQPDYVLGKADYKEKLDKLITELGLEKRVFFAGVVKGVDKYYLIKKAQIMVHMALWESFCNVVHEGLSQGLVCIVAKNTALPYLIEDGVNGFCIETKDYVEVARKINFVMKNKRSKLIKEMEARNRIYGLENSWRKVAGKMEQFYLKGISRVSSNPELTKDLNYAK